MLLVRSLKPLQLLKFGLVLFESEYALENFYACSESAATWEK